MVAEVRQARAEALQAGLAAIDGDTSIEAKLLRKEFEAAIETSRNDHAVRRARRSCPATTSAAPRSAPPADAPTSCGSTAPSATKPIARLESEFDWGELSAGAGTA